MENSIASLQKGIELGADIIEADIHITADDVPIVFHDKLLNRTTNTSGYTTDFTWKEYKDSIRLKNGQPVPSLEEFCLFIKDKAQKLYLDLKTLGNEVQILKICQEHLTNDQFLIGSFHNHSIKLIKQIDTTVQTVMIMEGNPIDIPTVVENSGCDVVAMGFDSIEEDSIPVCQEMGKKVFVWVVNDPREIQRARSLGVDGITSDYPDRL